MTAANSEWNFAGNKYLFATKDTAYILCYASDLQFTAEMQDEYRQLEEGIKDISIIKNGLLSD